jgi:hypothetical protein
VSSYAQAKVRYAELRGKAYGTAVAKLVPVLGVSFEISGWNRDAEYAYRRQWKTSEFPWEDIFRRYNEADRLDIVIWGPGKRLCGLGLAGTQSAAVEIRYIEGDPRNGCPLKGHRGLIVLEVAANYAQGRGKKELRIQPLNGAVKELYIRVYGFTLVSSHRTGDYLCKGV